MTNGLEKAKNGWGWIKNSPKWHYFDAKSGVSACRKWMRLGALNDLEDSNDNSADNCRACQQKVAKIRAETSRLQSIDTGGGGA